MCVPKYYLPKPFPMPQQLTPPLPLDRAQWANPYTGIYPLSVSLSGVRICVAGGGGGGLVSLNTKGMHVIQKMSPLPNLT